MKEFETKKVQTIKTYKMDERMQAKKEIQTLFYKKSETHKRYICSNIVFYVFSPKY